MTGYVVEYKTGGTENRRTRRSLPFPSMTEAEIAAAEVRRMGYECSVIPVKEA